MATDLYDAKQLLREAYRTDVGIHDYLAQSRREQGALPEQKRPLSTVAFFPLERQSWSGHKALAKRFAILKVHQTFGISFSDLLAYPRGYIDALLEAAEEELARAAQISNQLPPLPK